MKINLRYQVHQSKPLTKSPMATSAQTKGKYSPVFLSPGVMIGNGKNHAIILNKFFQILLHFCLFVS